MRFLNNGKKEKIDRSGIKDDILDYSASRKLHDDLTVVAVNVL